MLFHVCFISFRVWFDEGKDAGRRITDSATLITDLGMARSGKKKKSVIRVVVSVIGVI